VDTDGDVNEATIILVFLGLSASDSTAGSSLALSALANKMDSQFFPRPLFSDPSMTFIALVENKTKI
jgi:hypothetical protein